MIHIRLARAEAGFRSFNRRTPERLKRALTDYPAHLFLATESDGAICYGERTEKWGWLSAQLRDGLKASVLATIRLTENTEEPRFGNEH
jgi:hypothetical protein